MYGRAEKDLKRLGRYLRSSDSEKEAILIVRKYVSVSNAECTVSFAIK